MNGPRVLPLRATALALLFLAVCLAIAPTSAVVMDETQVQALLEVAQDLPVLSWTAAGLRAACDDNSAAPEIQSCNATGFPLSVRFSDGTGPAPAALSSLVALQKIWLDYGIKGSLPSAWSSLTNLEALDAYGGPEFVGGLPESWSAMTSLKALNVYYPNPALDSQVKQVASVLPSWISNVQGVEIGYAYWPSSSLPASIGTSTSLLRLRLIGCTFQGGMPAGLLNNTVINAFTVDSVGTEFGKGSVFPSDLSGMTSLEEWRISNAGFTGSIPTSFPATLKNFYMGYMPLIQGTVPQNLMNLPSLESFSVSALPKITGPIPTPTDISTSSLRDVAFTAMPGLTGTIPSSLFGISRRLTLTNLTGVVGPFPNIAQDCKITNLEVDSLKMNGPVPLGVLQNCPSLAQALLTDNGFTGQIANFNAGPLLEVFRLVDPLGGTIPTIKFQVPVLLLDFHGCELQGTVPTYLLNTTNFEQINLSNNKLDLCSNSQAVLATGFASTTPRCALEFQTPTECGCANVWPARCFRDRPMAADCNVGPTASSPASIFSFVGIALFASIVAIFVM